MYQVDPQIRIGLLIFRIRSYLDQFALHFGVVALRGIKTMADEVERFHIADYVVFSVMLLISALIGVWYGCGPGGKQKTTEEYLLADRSMPIWPVAISLLVSYLSAITLLGVPSEIYTYGGQYYVLILSYFLICSVVAIIFVPMFRRINLTCANEVSHAHYTS